MERERKRENQISRDEQNIGNYKSYWFFVYTSLYASLIKYFYLPNTFTVRN